jgi:hypothetical protein
LLHSIVDLLSYVLRRYTVLSFAAPTIRALEKAVKRRDPRDDRGKFPGRKGEIFTSQGVLRSGKVEPRWSLLENHFPTPPRSSEAGRGPFINDMS